MIPFQRSPALAAPDVRKGLLQGRHILIADDSAAIRFVAATALRAQGAIVHEVSDGAQAVSAALAGSFGLVLMDLQMPGMDGTEAAQQLRRAGLNEIPILGLTGSDADEFETCIAAGMNEVMQKPFTQALLVSRVMGLMGCAGADIAAIQVEQPEPVESPLFSTESLLVVCGGDANLMQRMLGIAVQELPFAAQQMRVAYGQGYIDEIGKIVHRVRPCVEGLGVAGLTQKLLRIEAMTADGMDVHCGCNILAVANDLERIARSIVTRQ